MKRLLFSIAITGLCACAPADSLPKALSVTAGDPARGQVLFSTRGDAHCVLCHQHANSPADFQGNIGPDLTDISARLSPGQIRLRIVDYERVRPGTLMPSYYRTQNFNQLGKAFDGKTVLTAQEIEDIIAYLVQGET